MIRIVLIIKDRPKNLNIFKFFYNLLDIINFNPLNYKYNTKNKIMYYMTKLSKKLLNFKPKN